MGRRRFVVLPKVRDCAILLIVLCAVSACAPTTTVTQRQAQTPPCLGNTATIHNGQFQVSDTNVARSMRETKFGLGAMPKAQLDAMGEGAYVRPQNSFLVISLRVENITKRPLGWDVLFPTSGLPSVHGYNLVNKEGLVFDNSQLGTFAVQQQGAAVSINPNTAKEGTIIFDVPTGNYDFTIFTERYGAAPFVGRTVTRTEVFRCSFGAI